MGAMGASMGAMKQRRGSVWTAGAKMMSLKDRTSRIQEKSKDVESAEEVQRRKHQSFANEKERTCKYAKAEVMFYKRLFDDMDKDGKGAVDFGQFRAGMKRQSSFLQDSAAESRKSSASPGSFRKPDMSTNQRSHSRPSALWASMERNVDGNIGFEQLLNVIYPNASREDMDTMVGWQREADKAMEVPVMTEEERMFNELTPGAREELRVLYEKLDLDGDGELTVQELRKGFMSKESFLEREDIDASFAEADTDGNGSLDFEEVRVAEWPPNARAVPCRAHPAETELLSRSLVGHSSLSSWS